jgi:hypothetical protein
MASIVDDPKGRKRILFVAGDGSRKALRLGKATMKQAEAFKVKVEALIGGAIAGVVDDEVSRWVRVLMTRCMESWRQWGWSPSGKQLTSGRGWRSTSPAPRA